MTEDRTPEVHVDQVAGAAHDAAVVDVREPAEFAQGHVRGAVLMPMGQLTARMSELDSSRPVYVICASGNRSRAMTDLLRSAGFDASSVAGGMQAWIQSGRSVEKGTR
ncbi:MAG: rhodanese-like domain-containing protein [Jatrophihabitans sp.]|uniref:rhodanese-like domain-containing protein n=1 Tax=Jatrophihabitans sp. TaxID=1932789 RepID=UPI003F7F13E2